MEALSNAKGLLESDKIKSVLKKIDYIEQFLARFETLDHLIGHFAHVENMLYTSKEFLNIDESAKYLGFSKSRMYKMAEKQEIPSYKPNGKNVFFAREDLNDWIRKAEVKSEQQIRKDAELAAAKYLLNNPL